MECCSLVGQKFGHCYVVILVDMVEALAEWSRLVAFDYENWERTHAIFFLLLKSTRWPFATFCWLIDIFNLVDYTYRLMREQMELYGSPHNWWQFQQCVLVVMASVLTNLCPMFKMVWLSAYICVYWIRVQMLIWFHYNILCGCEIWWCVFFLWF